MAQAPTSTGKVHQDSGRGHSDSASDHKSIYSRGDDLSGSGVITPAQAYARAVKTGENYDRSLYHTIERKQPDRRTEPQAPPLQLGNPRSERGTSFAQRLYASAVSNKSSTSLLSSIPVPPPNKLAPPSPALHVGAGRQSSRSVQQYRNSSRPPSLPVFDTSTEVTAAFSPADFYHSSVAFTSPDLSVRCPYSSIPVSQRVNAPLSSPLVSQSPSLAAYSQHRASHSQPEVAQRPLSVSQQMQAAPLPSETPIQAPAAYDMQTVREPPLPVPFVGASPPDVHILHPTATANATTSRSPSPYMQQSAEAPPVSSPLPSEERGISSIATGVAAGALILAPSPATLSHDDGLLESSLSPPPEAGHEEVPLYSLVDEQHPPPAFDDVNTTTPEVPRVPSCPSSPPPPSPLPSSHGTTSYPLEKVPSYSVLDSAGSSYPVRSSSRPPSVLSSRSADGQSTRSFYDHPACPNHSSSPPPPVVYHKKHRQSFFSPSTTKRPPNAQEFPNAPGIERDTMTSSWSAPRPLAKELPGNVRLAHVAGDNNDNVDTLTHAMSNIMGGPSSRRSFDTRSLVYEDGSGGQGYVGRTLLGNQQDIPGLHPSRPSQTVDSQNKAMYGAGGERLLQEAYQLVHAETGGEARLATQGSGPGLSQEIQQGYPRLLQMNDPRIANATSLTAPTHNLSSQHSPRASTVPHLDSVLPSYSHDEPRTQSAHIAEYGSLLSQVGGIAAAPQSIPYADGPRTTSMGSNLSPPSTQISYYPIDRYTHVPTGPQAAFAPVPLQEQNVHPQQPGLDAMQGRGQVAPALAITLQACHTPQTPQTSLYSQDNTKIQVGPCTGAAALNSNELARRFAHDALLASAGSSTQVFQGTDQRV
ncbi:hypothetical protein BS17DRAFT_72894 [Gyrodon lividus]|nr:hypothetical protein BS17DRAFT_72894 [Gyrodon lividus]